MINFVARVISHADGEFFGETEFGFSARNRGLGGAGNDERDAFGTCADIWFERRRKREQLDSPRAGENT